MTEDNGQPANTADMASLYLKMAAVMGHLERLPKRGTNKHFGYAYVTDSDVLDAVRKAMSQEHVAFFVNVDEVNATQKGSVVKLSMTFADGDTGATRTVPWVGEAHDTQDKGINKAVTAGVKYCLLKTFLMSTGDDDDPDSGGGSGEGSKATLGASAGNASAYKMRFGKHKGKTIAEIGGNPADAGYLKWALENLDDDERNVELFAAIKSYLGMTDGKPKDGPGAAHELFDDYDQPAGDEFLNGDPGRAADLEPQRKSWPAALVSAIVDAHLAENVPNTLGMLNLSKVLDPADSKKRVLTWANFYRSARGEMESKDAAATADTALIESEKEKA